jgi:predicted ATP-grasp superfamily ATP-dependent carboligase
MKIALLASNSSGTLTKELQRRGNEVVLLCGKDSDPGVPLADHSRAIYFDSRSTATDYRDAAGWILDNAVDGLILGSGTVHSIEIARLCAIAGVPLSHSIDHVLLFKNKWKTKRLLRQHEMRTPDACMISDENKELPRDLCFPVVVKSNLDLFGVSLVHERETLRQYLRQQSVGVLRAGVLLEKFIDGNDCTVPVFLSGRHSYCGPVVYWSKQLNYALPGFTGLKPTRLTVRDEQRVREQCLNVLSSINYRGVCRFDIRVGDDDLFFLEINEVISIRDEGTSFQAMQAAGVSLVSRAVDTYLENILELQ